MRIFILLCLALTLDVSEARGDDITSRYAFVFIDRASATSLSLYHSLISGSANDDEDVTLATIEDVLSAPQVQLADMVVATLALQYLTEKSHRRASEKTLDAITKLYDKTKNRYSQDKIKRREFLSCTLFGTQKLEVTLKAIDSLIGAENDFFKQIHETRFSKTDKATLNLSAKMYGLVSRETVLMTQIYRSIADFHKRSPEGVLDERIDIALLLRNLAVAYNQTSAYTRERATKKVVKQLEKDGIIPAASLKDRVYSYIEVEYIPWLESAVEGA